MRSAWPARALLPAVQALAEGSWLAVVYAALQAAAGEVAYMGPLELGAVALAGTAWGRRQRGTSPIAGRLALPLLVLLAGLFGLLESPAVRASVLDGNFLGALTLHTPGWLAALAFARGNAHRARADDSAIQDQLMRWGVPGLAVPWLIGYASASGQLEDDFAAAAFVGTIFFIGSAFTALGLARLEAVRLATGSDWRQNRSWLVSVIGLALALTAFTIPGAALLGIPSGSLLAGVAGPLETLILLMVLLTAPVLFLAAFIADLLRSLLPPDAHLPTFSLPSFKLLGGVPGSDLPTIILTVIFAAFFLAELIFLLAIIWLTLRRERKWGMNPLGEAFEERSIVVPRSDPGPPAAADRIQRRRSSAEDDATRAYLAALDALQEDGRWSRKEHETPAAHLARARAQGLASPSFGRLAAAYQLARYGGRPLPDREERRAQRRLQRLRVWLQDTQHP